MLATVQTAILVGVDGHPVQAEIHVGRGLPCYTVVGLPDTAIRESRERVRAAITTSGLTWPQHRVTVNLAPSALRKSGAGLDLPVALGLVLATGDVPAGALDGIAALGELGLDGSVRPVPGVLALVDALRAGGTSAVLLPAANAAEAALVGGIRILPCTSLVQARDALKGEREWPDVDVPAGGRPSEPGEGEPPPVDLGDVRGLAGARQALEVAAAGGHHLLLVGPPGAGKTLLAHCLPSILPPLLPDEALEVTKVHSAAGRPIGGALVDRRPFRAPHHSASSAALVGGGSGRPRPGEVTLAHRGCLFLDELGEFAPTVLDALRQPLEERVVRISRQGGSLSFPADFLLVACSNPCPCGLGPPRCTCNDGMRARYKRRLSAPLVDRFDLRVAVGPASAEHPPGPPSEDARARVEEAVGRQLARYHDVGWRRNARVPAGALSRLVPLGPDAADALRRIARRRELSGRGLAAIHRIARTVADLEGAEVVGPPHLLVAAGLREEVL